MSKRDVTQLAIDNVGKKAVEVLNQIHPCIFTSTVFIRFCLIRTIFVRKTHCSHSKIHKITKTIITNRFYHSSEVDKSNGRLNYIYLVTLYLCL